MDTSELDYHLPPSAVAQRPAEPRDAARLLVDQGPCRPPAHRGVGDLPELLRPGDVVVVNTTRVLPARLRLTKPSGGAVEVLLLEPEPAPGAGDRTHAPEPGGWQRWWALVRPGRRARAGTRLAAGDDLELEIGGEAGDGLRHVRLRVPADRELLEVLGRHGSVALPPYITAALDDPERYQTVYAREPGSVAAPTAGLHLTAELLAGIEASGARVVPVELVVGLGTFRPIEASSVAEHHMHEERYRIPEATMAACRDAERVVAVGTTSVRALESAAERGELEGRTDLFIHGDRPFLVVDALLTNFHLPRSSLLALVHAFVGDRWRDLYGEALAAGYRFLSFGDAMFLPGRRGHG